MKLRRSCCFVRSVSTLTVCWNALMKTRIDPNLNNSIRCHHGIPARCRLDLSLYPTLSVSLLISLSVECSIFITFFLDLREKYIHRWLNKVLLTGNRCFLQGYVWKRVDHHEWNVAKFYTFFIRYFRNSFCFFFCDWIDS